MPIVGTVLHTVQVEQRYPYPKNMGGWGCKLISQHCRIGQSGNLYAAIQYEDVLYEVEQDFRTENLTLLSNTQLELIISNGRVGTHRCGDVPGTAYYTGT